MASERNQLIWGEIVARAWRDQEYKQRLLDNPKEVLIEAGSSVPDELEVRVVENTSNVRYLVLPESPAAAGQRLSERSLDGVSGGGFEFAATNTSIAAESQVAEAAAVVTTEAAAAETTELAAVETTVGAVAESVAAIVIIPVLIS
jgi:hypothetical protein